MPNEIDSTKTAMQHDLEYGHISQIADDCTFNESVCKVILTFKRFFTNQIFFQRLLASIARNVSIKNGNAPLNNQRRRRGKRGGSKGMKTFIFNM